MSVQMLTHPAPAHVPTGSRATEPGFAAIVAVETTELARRLRSSGWVARAGWISCTPCGRVWNIRFESPGEHAGLCQGQNHAEHTQPTTRTGPTNGL
jgi:hypothetical protein